MCVCLCVCVYACVLVCRYVCVCVYVYVCMFVGGLLVCRMWKYMFVDLSPRARSGKTASMQAPGLWLTPAVYGLHWYMTWSGKTASMQASGLRLTPAMYALHWLYVHVCIHVCVAHP